MTKRIVLIVILVAVLGAVVAGAWWWLGRNTGEKLLQRADLALRARNYERALELARSYTADSPDDWRGLFYQARAHIALGRYEEARTALIAASKIAPGEIRIPMARADTFAHPARRALTSQGSDVSVEVLDRAIDGFGHAADVLAGIAAPGEATAADISESLGLIQTELGAAEDMKRQWYKTDADTKRQAGADSDAEASARESEAAGARADGHFKEAARLLLTVVQHDAKSAGDPKARIHERAANALVRLCLDKGYRETLAAARKTIESLKAPPLLAKTMLITSDLARSDTEPLMPADKEKMQAAAKKLDAVLQQFPSHPDVVQIKQTRAQIALQLGDYETVEQLCNSVLKDDPRNAQARLMLANARMDSGHADQAERDLFALKTQFPKWALAHFAYARAALKSGKKELAKEALRTATRLAPDHLGARLLLADILLQGGFADDAFLEAQALFHARQENPAAVATYAKTAGRTGKRELIDALRDALIRAQPVLKLPEAPPQTPDDLKRWCDTLHAFAMTAEPVWPAGDANLEIKAAAKALAAALKKIAEGRHKQARLDLEEENVSRQCKRLRTHAETILAYHAAKWLAVGDGYNEVGAWAKGRKDTRMQAEAVAAAKASWQQAIRAERTTLTERLAAAEAMLRLGRADDAEKLLTETVTAYPKSAEAYVQLGRFYVVTNRPSKAIEAYKVAVELAPRNAVSHLALAGTLYDVGLLDEAKKEVKKALDLAPSYEPARLLATQIAVLRGEPAGKIVGGKQEGLSLAMTYLTLGKPKECAGICQAALRENEDNLPARWLLGQAYGMLNQPKDCVAQWKKYLTAAPGQSPIYRALAQVLNGVLDMTPQEVGQELGSVPGARPELVDLAVGRLFERHRQFEAAAEAYGRAAGRTDAPPDTRHFARIDRANCLAMAGHIDRAIVELDQLPKHDPWRDRVLIHKTQILARAGRVEDALPLLLVLQTRAGQAGNIGHLVGVGNLYLSMKQPDKALAVADEVDRLRPKGTQACLLRAAALNALGRPDEAIEACRKAVAREPTSVRLRMLLAASLDARGRLRESLDVLAELQGQSETAETQALYQQGVLLIRWGLYKQAAERLGRLAEKGGVVAPGLRVALGRALARLGEADKAREQLQQVSRYAPQYVVAQQLLAELAATDDEKLAILRRVLADRPGLASVVSQRMSILERAGRPRDAVKEFRAFVDRLPEAAAPSDGLTLYAVHILLKEGDRQAAAQLCLQAVKRTRKHLWNRLAILLMMDDDPDKAASRLPDAQNAFLLDTLLGICIAAQTGQGAAKWADRFAAIEQRLAHEEPPRHMPPAYKVLATVATKGTMKDEKVAAFTGDDLVGFSIMHELLASAKTDPGIRAEAARLLKATAARELNLNDVSRAWAMEALKARPTSQWAAALAVSGLTDPAALREILKIIKPDDCVLARTIRALALDQEKQYEKAVEVYRLAAEAENGNPLLVMRQAVATERAGRLQDALPLYRQVWEKTKKPMAANNAAYLVSELYPKDAAKLAEALTWADAALQAAPRAAGYRDTKGWIAYLLGRNDDALTELRRAVRGLPDSPEVHYHLAMAEAKGGDQAMARQHLEAAVNLGEHMTAQNQGIADAVSKAIRLAKEALADLGPPHK